MMSLKEQFDRQLGVVKYAILIATCVLMCLTFYYFFISEYYVSYQQKNKKIADEKAKITQLKKHENNLLDIYEKDVVTTQRAANSLNLALKGSKGVTVRQMKILPANKLGKFYEHRIILILSGQYKDIVNYVHVVQEKEPQLFWHKMEYKVDVYPMAVVTLHLSVVNNEQYWLSI